MASPYIGITGFNTHEQVGRVVENISGYPIGYVMFGFTSSNKRLLDPESSGKTSPSLNALRSLTRCVPVYHLPMIHYYTPNPETVADEVIALFKHCDLDSSHCGLQLNLAWPGIDQLKALLDAFGESFKVTMQLPKKVLELSDYEIVKGLELYEGLVSYVLIDPSGGLGLDFDIDRAAGLMDQISKGVGITPGVAGGFSAENVAERINKIRLASRCESCNKPNVTDYCIDAQGKLRKKLQVQPVYPKDSAPIEKSVLDTDKCINYIDSALQAFFDA